MYDQSILNRFWSKVKKADGCWEWQAGTNTYGYGTFNLNKKTRSAHRVSWAISRGPISEGMCILHHCDNPACVRLDHLFIGTHSDNNNDSVAKGRWGDRGGENHGNSKLVENDVYEIRRLRSLGVTQPLLAKMWKISRPHVSLIVRRKTWRNI